jgi:spermidine synthase
MKKFSLIYAFLLMGFTAIVAQVILIRELLTSFSGNELAIGIFFANWLLLEALGSFGAGRWAAKINSGTTYYAVLQLFLALAFPVVILLTRIAKHLLGIIPGQGINMLTVFYASLFLLIPLGLADGAQFSFGCRMFTESRQKPAVLFGKVYIYEAIGSLVGGIAGTYLCLQYLNSFQTAFALALLNIFSAILLLVFVSSKPKIDQFQEYKAALYTSRFTLKVAAVALMIICVLLFPLGGIDYLHTHSVRAQWRHYNVLDYRNSIYGNVTVLQRLKQLNIMANGVPISTIPTPDIAFIEEFVHLALLSHPNPQKVLLVGGGIGGVLKEMLKHPIQEVNYAELDPLIIRTAQQHAPSFTASDLNDPRVNIHYVDGRYLIRTRDERYDVIFINLPDPSTLEINRFYTLEFYHMSKQRLKADGILCFVLPGSMTYLSREMIDLNATIIQTTKHVLPFLNIIPGESNLLLVSSNESVITNSPDILIQRMRDRSLQIRLLTDFHIRYKFDERRLQWYHNEIRKAGEMLLNRDFHPSALYYDLVFWNSVHSPAIAKIFSQLKYLRFRYIIIPIALMFVILLLLQRYLLAWQKSFIILPIIATGFTGMSVDIVLVLAFQSLYGYIYHWIGLLIAAFMVGLTLGGMWITRRLSGVHRSEQKNAIDDYATFSKLEVFIVLYSAALIGVLYLLNRFQEYAFIFAAAQYILLFLNALCGFLVGAEFPLANSIYLKHTVHYTQTAGKLYAADLIGSWVGALFVTIAFIPLLGIMHTCLLVLFVNLCSLLLFVFSKR